MNRKIYNWSFGYQMCKLYVSLAQKLFYNKIIVKGVQNIPKGKPVIFAPNHQNAIQDALAVVCNVPEQVVFMARADVFSNKIISRILRFIKIMPVYRIRDGYENLAKNENAFSEAIEVLFHNKSLCLMPEGTHGDKHQLQPLIKGIFRIAFMALDNKPDNPPVIIPVGIDYSFYYRFRSQLIVQFGKPIEVAGFFELYKSSQPMALNALRTRLSEEMKKIMINIDCGEFYENIDYLRALIRPLVLKNLEYKKQNAWNRFIADNWLVEKCNIIYRQNPEFISSISNETLKTKLDLDQFKIPSEFLLKDKQSLFFIIFHAILLLVFSPIFLIGYSVHILLIRLSRLFNKHLDDRQFHSSVKFATVTFSLPIFYFLIGIIISKFNPHWYFILAVIAGVILTGEFAYCYFEKFQQLIWSIKIKVHKKFLEATIARIQNIWISFQNAKP